MPSKSKATGDFRQRLWSTTNWSLNLNTTLLLALLPGILALVVTTYISFERERAAAYQDLLSRVRSMSQLMDEQLLHVQNGLELIATASNEIDEHNLKNFYGILQESQRKLTSTNGLILFETNGNMLLSTLSSFGTPLPVSSSVERIQRVARTGQPQITPIFTGKLSGKEVIAIDVPIQRNGKVVYVLSASFLCTQINQLLLKQNFPPEWIAVIYDSTGVIAARTLNPEQSIGKEVAPTLLDWLDGPEEFFGEGRTLEGKQSVAAMHRSKLTGYSVAVSVPAETLLAPLRGGLILNILAIGASLLVGTFVAWYFSQTLRKSIRILERATQGIASGASNIVLPEGGIPELQRLSLRFKNMFIALKESKEINQQYLTQLELAATHDSLTGLANRLLINDRIEQAVYSAQRCGRWTAVVLLDLDHFKVVNDTLTHIVGDALLVEVANRLKSQVRQTDTVGRFGGDEFVIVLTDIETNEDAMQLVSKLMRIISHPYEISARRLTISASIGVTLAPRDGTKATELIKNADIAMYRAKDAGRAAVEFFSVEMHDRVQRRLEMEADLRRAIQQNEFVVYYQPRCDLNTGKIIGAEALIRWRHPTMGLVSPAEFIPLAEETGLINPIGEWVLQSACETARRWHHMGYSDILVSVNVAARQLQSNQLRDVVAKCIATSRLTPSLLELELTESDVMKDPGAALKVLQEIKALGVRISLDDFGTGYSSLSYLKRFPVDCLKIDRSFIRDITIDPEDAAIAQMIVALGHNLKQTVVAEGVETRAQLNFLKAHHCDQMQGYLFSPPVQANEFEAMLLSGKHLESEMLQGNEKNFVPDIHSSV
jgi:diguanylate cyclase (GGDEF)-like protein